VEETNSIGMPLLLIPPGEFDMGSTPDEIAAEIARAEKKKEFQDFLKRLPPEAPRHRVKITKPFYLAMYQVTQSEYEKIMGVNPSAFKNMAGKNTSRHPVETVNWNDATEFCRRLSAMPAERTATRVYRLPTEAESEYACRAGTTTRWWCGDDEASLRECAWYSNNAGGMTHPVGEKHPNAWGLYDMHGNVWHWCSDWFGADYYKQSPSSDPSGPATGSSHAYRGGSWADYPFCCRSASRYSHEPAYRNHYFGFRVAVGR
jgi:formylglycine-generating enzyme required for sulfatase activity